MKKTISISILDCNPLEIKENLDELINYNISNIHLDIMDTSFVKNISFGTNMINKILNYDFTFDCHFMINDPSVIIDKLSYERIDRIIYHAEIPAENQNKIQKYNRKTGIAINPDTSLTHTNEEFILVMTVNPGMGGQKFKLDDYSKLGYNDKIIGVDGGINLETVGLVKKANFFVVGSAFFRSGDKESFLRKMHEIIDE